MAGTSVRSVGMRNFGKQGSRNVFTECQRHEAHDGPQVVEVFFHDRLEVVAHGRVAVPPQGLDGILVGGCHSLLLTDVVEPGKQIGKRKGNPVGQFVASLFQYLEKQDIFAPDVFRSSCRLAVYLFDTTV